LSSRNPSRNSAARRCPLMLGRIIGAPRGEE
jgi:hypothetical protein